MIFDMIGEREKLQCTLEIVWRLSYDRLSILQSLYRIR